MSSLSYSTQALISAAAVTSAVYATRDPDIASSAVYKSIIDVLEDPEWAEHAAHATRKAYTSSQSVDAITRDVCAAIKELLSEIRHVPEVMRNLNASVNFGHGTSFDVNFYSSPSTSETLTSAADTKFDVNIIRDRMPTPKIPRHKGSTMIDVPTKQYNVPTPLILDMD